MSDNGPWAPQAGAGRIGWTAARCESLDVGGGTRRGAGDFLRRPARSKRSRLCRTLVRSSTSSRRFAGLAGGAQPPTDRALDGYDLSPALKGTGPSAASCALLLCKHRKRCPERGLVATPSRLTSSCRYHYRFGSVRQIQRFRALQSRRGSVGEVRSRRQTARSVERTGVRLRTSTSRPSCRSRIDRERAQSKAPRP